MGYRVAYWLIREGSIERTTDEPTLEMSKTLGRYEGGRTDRPTRAVKDMAKIDARKSVNGVAYVWREDGPYLGPWDLVLVGSHNGKRWSVAS